MRHMTHLGFTLGPPQRETRTQTNPSRLDTRNGGIQQWLMLNTWIFSHLQISCSFPRSLVLFWQFSQTHDGSMVLVYMLTFTIKIPQMLVYIPYMDPMGNWGNNSLQVTGPKVNAADCRLRCHRRYRCRKNPRSGRVTRRGTQRRRAVVAKLCCRLAEIPKIAEPKHLRKGTLRGRMWCVDAIRCHSNSVPTLAPCNVACMSSLAREASNHGVLSGSPVGHMFCAGIYAPPQSGHTTCQHAPTCRDPTCYNPFGHHFASSIQWTLLMLNFPF